MNASSWGPRKHRLAVSEPPSLTLGGRICALWAPAAVPERASTRAPPTLSQRGSRRAPPGRSVLVRDGDPRLQGAEHTRRMARAAQILHSRPSMAAAGRVGWREGRVVRKIPQISLKMAVSFSGEAGEHAPRVRARVDEWSPRDRRTTFRVRAHTAQLRVVTRLPIARAGCKCSFLAPGARWQGLEARPKGKSSPQSSRGGRWAGSIELPHTWSGGTSGLAARSPTDACLFSKPTRLHRRVVCQRHAGTPTSRARSAVIGVETA